MDKFLLLLGNIVAEAPQLVPDVVKALGDVNAVVMDIQKLIADYTAIKNAQNPPPKSA